LLWLYIVDFRDSNWDEGVLIWVFSDLDQRFQTKSGDFQINLFMKYQMLNEKLNVFVVFNNVLSQNKTTLLSLLPFEEKISSSGKKDGRSFTSRPVWEIFPKLYTGVQYGILSWEFFFGDRKLTWENFQKKICLQILPIFFYNLLCHLQEGYHMIKTPYLSPWCRVTMQSCLLFISEIVELFVGTFKIYFACVVTGFIRFRKFYLILLKRYIWLILALKLMWFDSYNSCN